MEERHAVNRAENRRQQDAMNNGGRLAKVERVEDRPIWLWPCIVV
jgi:hypothetical protein